MSNYPRTNATVNVKTVDYSKVGGTDEDGNYFLPEVIGEKVWEIPFDLARTVQVGDRLVFEGKEAKVIKRVYTVATGKAEIFAEIYV